MKKLIMSGHDQIHVLGGREQQRQGKEALAMVLVSNGRDLFISLAEGERRGMDEREHYTFKNDETEG